MNKAQVRPYLVGIAGGSGSGKTTLLNQLRVLLPEGSMSLVSQDNYYHPSHLQEADQNGELNFDLPGSIDRELFLHDINQLLKGESIFKEEYTFNNPDIAPKLIEIKSAPIIITEGLFVFYYDEIRSLLDYKVYLHAEEGVRLNRRIYRDKKERGYDENVVRYQWNNHVKPADTNYLFPFRGDCDLVIDNTHDFGDKISVLANHLLKILSKRNQ
jgi:uridine kinase